jgi:hypothetical protein
LTTEPTIIMRPTGCAARATLPWLPLKSMDW